MLTTEEKEAFKVVAIVGRAIKELGEVPSGHLYARLMDVMNLDQYQAIIGILKKAGLINEENYLLTWVGGNDECNV